MSTINFYNIDCMEFMKTIPDKYYDLSIVDPPYGIGISGQKEQKLGKKSDRKFHKDKNWDNEIPSLDYFNELKRISKNQIIWGANYFVKNLFEGHKGWIIWDKQQHGLTMSDCELAYSSFDCPTRIWTKNRCVLKEQNTIHAKEKPIYLYRWLLQNYAKQGDKIFDSHGGSMGIAIACDMEGFDLDICELDKEYFDSAVQRFNTYKRQLTLF